MKGDDAMGGIRRIKLAMLALVSLTFVLMISCTSVDTGAVINFPAMAPTVAPLTADSYEIKGRVTGTAEVSFTNPSDGDTLHYGVLTPSLLPSSIEDINYNAFDVAIANAIYEMVRQGEELGADFLLFPTYMLENTENDTLKVRATAVAAALIDR
jgi:hypothetical protein